MGIVKNEWINQMSVNIKLATGCGMKEATEFTEELFTKHFVDHEVQIYNSYEQEITDIRLSEIPDLIKRDRLIMTEAGTLFYPRGYRENLNAEISAFQLDDRKVHKNLKFKAKDAGDYKLESYEDGYQLRRKKQANSGYGAKGNAMSFLHSFNTASSTTASGRGQVSMASQCYENLLADAVKFMNIDEFCAYIQNIMNERHIWTFDLDDIIDIQPTRKDLYKRMIAKFHPDVKFDKDMVKTIIENIPDKFIPRIFFKSNIRAFLKQKTVRKLYHKLMMIDCSFPDPNSPPKIMEAELQLFGELVVEFVNYKYQPFRYEDRSKYGRREVTIIMDTDSNFLYYGSLFDYVADEVLPTYLFRNKEERKEWEIKLLNVLAYASTKANQDVIWHYLDRVGVDEDIRYRVVMKNEYSYPIVIVTTAMKSYIASCDRQESFIYDELELEVKGVSFFKSTTTAKTSKFIYDDILMKSLLAPESGKIELPDIIRKISKFKTKIAEEIKTGDLDYMKKAKVRSEDGYSEPMEIGQYKACYIWNALCEDEIDKIELPSIVTMVKTRLYSKADLYLLEDFPEMYEAVKKLMDDPYINGTFMNGKLNKKTGKPINRKPKGITSIALPYGMDKMPDWVKAIIDVDTIVHNNMSLFNQLYKPLGLTPVNARYAEAKKNLKYYANVVKL